MYLEPSWTAARPCVSTYVTTASLPRFPKLKMLPRSSSGVTAGRRCEFRAVRADPSRSSLPEFRRRRRGVAASAEPPTDLSCLLPPDCTAAHLRPRILCLFNPGRRRGHENDDEEEEEEDALHDARRCRHCSCCCC